MIYLKWAADLFLLCVFSMNVAHVNSRPACGERGLQIVCADSEGAVITNGGLFFSSQLAVSVRAWTHDCICVCSCNKLAPVQQLRVSNSVRTSHKTLHAVGGFCIFLSAKLASFSRPEKLHHFSVPT